MTAIDGLARLEAPGIWRPGAGEQRRDVYVGIGEAELVIQDRAGVALTHWSLPALVRRNPGKTPALYIPAPGADEELEIAEPEMIAILDRLTDAVEKGRQRPGRLRRILTGLTLGAAIGFAAMWVPGALRDHSSNALPPSTQAEIGARILSRIIQVTGPACSTPVGAEALETLQARLWPLGGPTLTVLRDLPQPAIALPGGRMAVAHDLFLSDDEPALAAGEILATQLAAGPSGPLDAVLARLGPLGLVRLLTTGEASQDALEAEAAARLQADPAPPDAAVLRPGFAQARLAWRPYAEAHDLSVPDNAPPMPPTLDDSAWLALQGICDG